MVAVAVVEDRVFSADPFERVAGLLGVPSFATEESNDPVFGKRTTEKYKVLEELLRAETYPKAKYPDQWMVVGGDAILVVEENRTSAWIKKVVLRTHVDRQLVAMWILKDVYMIQENRAASREALHVLEVIKLRNHLDRFWFNLERLLKEGSK
jgi:hypothetical protein